MNELNNIENSTGPETVFVMEENSTSPTTNPVVQEQVINNINIKPYKELTKEEKDIMRFYKINHEGTFAIKNIFFFILLIIWLFISAYCDATIGIIILVLISTIIYLYTYFSNKNYYNKHPESINLTEEYIHSKNHIMKEKKEEQQRALKIGPYFVWAVILAFAGLFCMFLGMAWHIFHIIAYICIAAAILLILLAEYKDRPNKENTNLNETINNSLENNSSISTVPPTTPISNETIVNQMIHNNEEVIIATKSYNQLTVKERSCINFHCSKPISKLKKVFWKNLNIIALFLLCIGLDESIISITIIAIILLVTFNLVEFLYLKNYYKKHPESCQDTEEFKKYREYLTSREKLPFMYLLLCLAPIIIFIIIGFLIPLSLPTIALTIIGFIASFISINLFLYFCDKYKIL